MDKPQNPYPLEEKFICDYHRVWQEGSDATARQIIEEVEKFNPEIKQGLRGEIWQALKALYCADQTETIEDGFGSVWSAYCHICHKKTMVIVRPGDARCNECG